MNNFKLSTIPFNRTDGYFPKINSWAFMIKTGSRCTGLLSNKPYQTERKAFEAGERMIARLEKKG